MSGIDEKLTAKQETLLAALLVSRSLAEAAGAAHISEATARRWLALPHVQRAYLDARRQVVDAALSAVQSATAEAVDTLRSCMAEDMPPGVRVRAAIAILETAVKAVEVSDLAARLDALEHALETQQQQPRHLHQMGPRPIA